MVIPGKKCVILLYRYTSSTLMELGPSARELPQNEGLHGKTSRWTVNVGFSYKTFTVLVGYMCGHWWVYVADMYALMYTCKCYASMGMPHFGCTHVWLCDHTVKDETGIFCICFLYILYRMYDHMNVYIHMYIYIPVWHYIYMILYINILCYLYCIYIWYTVYVYRKIQ